MTSTVQRAITLALIVAGGSSCRLGKVDVPDLAGPSGFGLSIQLTASPDLLPRDGQSASTITITARDDKSQPKQNLGLRIDLTVNGVPGDFGTLSARTVYTNSQGLATVVYTAPKGPAFESPDRTAIGVTATPIGTDAGNSTASAVSISLVPQGTIVVPNKLPVPQFFSTPSQPAEGDTVHFDASQSTDPDGVIVQYDWSFGDGDVKSSSSPLADHAYKTPGTFTVKLTVTDNGGGTSTSAGQLIQIGVNQTIAAFTVSPSAPEVGVSVFFNASTTKPQPGASIASYVWDFGDGSPTATGVTTSHTYTTQANYTVTLTVTDSTGKALSTSQSVQISTNLPTASFVFSPTDPLVGQDVFFDASASNALPGRTIVGYSWNFGDGSPLASGVRPPAHQYQTKNTFTVTLVVTDSAGKQQTTSSTVAVK